MGIPFGSVVWSGSVSVSLSLNNTSLRLPDAGGLPEENSGVFMHSDRQADLCAWGLAGAKNRNPTALPGREYSPSARALLPWRKTIVSAPQEFEGVGVGRATSDNLGTTRRGNLMSKTEGLTSATVSNLREASGRVSAEISRRRTLPEESG